MKKVLMASGVLMLISLFSFSLFPNTVAAATSQTIRVNLPVQNKITEGSTVKVAWEPVSVAGLQGYSVILTSKKGGFNFGVTVSGTIALPATTTSLSTVIASQIVTDLINRIQKAYPGTSEAEIRENAYFIVNAIKNDPSVIRGKSQPFKLIPFSATIPQINAINNAVDVNGTLDIFGKNFGSSVSMRLFDYKCTEKNVEGDCTWGPIDVASISNVKTLDGGTHISIPVSKFGIGSGSSYINRYLNLVLNRTDNNAETQSYINISEDLVADKIQILEPGVLKRTYDSTQATNKESLKASFKIRVTSEARSVTRIGKKGGFYFIAATTTDQSKYPSFAYASGVYSKPEGSVSDVGDVYLIPEGKSAIFTVTTSFNTLAMFAGNYKAYLSSVCFSDGSALGVCQNVFGPVQKKNNTTNSVIILGEVSPYITDVATLSNVGGSTQSITVSGVRFENSMRVYVNNKDVYTATATPATYNGTRKLLIPVSALGLSGDGGPQGIVIQVEGLQSNTGRSNSVYVSVVPPRSITVNYPNGGEILPIAPKTTDTISGFEQYEKDITWTGVPDYEDTYSSNPSVKAYLESFVGGSYVTLGRIPAFGFGSIKWVSGVISKTDCDLVYPSSLPNNCFNYSNLKLAPAGDYYVRLVDSKTNTWDRSDTSFKLSNVSTPACPSLQGFVFTKNLALGSSDPEVLYLQCFLISKGHFVTGAQTGYFGETTKNALITYEQVKGISPASGYFGPLTRAAVNADLASSPSQVPHINSITSSVPVGGTLNVTGSGLAGTKIFIDSIERDFGTAVSYAIDGTAINVVLPTPIPAGQHTFKVLGQPAAGFSNTVNFQIATPTPISTASLNLISPNGGEKYILGGSMTVSWKAENFQRDATVYAELRPRGAGLNQVMKIAVVPAKNSTYSWNIPTTIIPGEYLVEVYRADKSGKIDPNESVKDVSENPFTISKSVLNIKQAGAVDVAIEALHKLLFGN